MKILKSQEKNWQNEFKYLLLQSPGMNKEPFKKLKCQL
nr:MAG TPA: hypothetical protein [Caudoviricetes sp.]